MSKIDYCNNLFKGLPKYEIQRVNKLIQACAGFAKYKYGELKDIADLNWLLIEKRIDFALMKLVFNGLNDKDMPKNLQPKLSTEKRSLRKNSVMLVHQNENITPVFWMKPIKYLITFQMKYDKIFMRCRFQCSKIN